MLDRSDFESLFRNEFQGLVRFSMMYVKDFEVAREVVQEAFLTLWEKREEIDVSKSVKSYLSTAIRNRSLNYLRDNKKFDTGLMDVEGLYPDKA
ncbi:MAG: sigma factor, partial [Bacteroidota bacterium]|nr:sigma factor [Bacteroidota bacterium]